MFLLQQRLCWCPWLCYHQRSSRYPWSVLPPEALLMSVGHAAAGDYTGIHGLNCCRGPCGFPWSVMSQRAILMSMGIAAAGDHVEAHSQFCWQRPCRCWCDFHGPHCHWGPYWYQWPVLLYETMWRSMIHAPGDYKGQKSYFYSGIDFRLTVEKERQGRLLWKSLPAPNSRSNILDRKPQRVFLKTVIRTLKCSSPQSVAPEGVPSGEGLSFL